MNDLIEMISGVAINDGNLIWMGWSEVSFKKETKLAGLPEFLTTNSFKCEKRVVNNKRLFNVFFLKENVYHNVVSSFYPTEDTDLNDTYHKLKMQGKAIDYFIAFEIFTTKSLREKITQINLNPITYPDRERQIRCMNEEIENGKYDAAELRATNILQSLNNLAGITPLSLQEKIIKIHLNKTTYPDKERQIIVMSFVMTFLFSVALISNFHLFYSRPILAA